MSISADRDSFFRLSREISSLRGKEADELKKESEASRRMNTAADQASKATTNGSRSSYLSTASREQKTMEDAQRKRAQISSDIARKSVDASKLEERIARAEAAERKKSSEAAEKSRKLDETERKKLAQANETLRRENQTLQRIHARKIQELERQIGNRSEQTEMVHPVVAPSQTEIQDFFISHAHKDKEDFVNGLVAAARTAGLKVWYDEFDLTWGDTIRQKIDKGLAGSYFGVVVLSPNFFGRSWTGYELDGILQKDLSGDGRLLPIWHRLTQDDVKKHAPSLAGRMALSTSDYDTDEIVEQLLRMREKFRTVPSDRGE